MISVRRFLYRFLSVVMWIPMATFFHSVHQYKKSSALLILSEVFLLLLLYVFIPSTRRKMILISDIYDEAFLVLIFVIVLKHSLKNETIEYVFDILPPLDIHVMHLYVVISICWNFIPARVLSENDDRQNGFPAKVFDDGVCAVCMLAHVNPSRPTCGHTFCFDCLISWCRIKIACPICSHVFARLQHTSDDDGQTRIITVDKYLLMDYMPFDFGIATLTLKSMWDFPVMFFSINTAFRYYAVYVYDNV
jgi:hypothetical protein